MADNERFYDDEIGPALLALARRCQDRGMGLVACVAYNDDGSTARTITLPEGSPAVLRWMNALAQCGEGAGVNIDKFLMAVMKEARERGHNSVYLERLGVPIKPEQ